MKKDFAQALREGRVVIDGSMGALLSAMGVQSACPDMVGVEQPSVIRGIHRSYLDAGANVVITDTFGSSPAKLGKQGLASRTAEIACKAVENARAEAGESGFVALDVGPTGEMLYPMGTLTADKAIAGYREQIRAGKEADFVLMETMTDIGEGRTGMLAAKEEGMPFAASFSFETSGRTMTGGAPECAAIIAKALGALAVGMNCSGGPEHMIGPLTKMRSVTDLPVIVQPNAGLPEMRGGVTIYPFGPERFVEEMKPILAAGAAAVGGCCGTTPEHIRLLALEAAQYPAAQPLAEAKTYVCSARKYAEIGKALENKETVDEIDDLYDIEDDTLLAVIDLRGSDPDDIAEDIATAVTATHAPLGFIADDAGALEAALRSYTGVAAVCAPDSCASVIEKYGAVRVEALGETAAMDEFVFISPDPAYAEELLAFKQEFLAAGSATDGCGELRKTEDIAEYIRICDAHTRRETLPEGRSLARQLWYVRKRDGKLIGMLSIRLELIGYLERYGGNIGYSVRPSFRQQGHAKRMLAMALPLCRELGLKKLLITCLEDNIASERTIRANGGIYESTVYDESKDVRLKRFWIEL